MPCVLQPPPLHLKRGHRCVCEEARTAKNTHIPSSSASSSSSSSSSSSLAWLSPNSHTLHGGQRVYLPPRLCTLREFGEGMASARPHESARDFFSSLSAIVELSAQVQNWEVLSGRLAMMVFTSALMLEALTGNTVFEKEDSQRLLEYCGAALVSILVAAGFAVALQAKSRVASTVSKGYEKLINGLIDNTIDSLLFDNKEC